MFKAYIDCLHLQLYREPRDRQRAHAARASLSLQQFLGFESGFTLDKEAHTLAILCQDLTTTLAFDTRERLISWQVKVGSQLGCSQEFVVVVPAVGVGSGSGRLPAGPARLHLRRSRLALTTGTPPRVLGVWELQHLRRYGVVEGRFAWEGGARCGKHAGVYGVAADRPQDIRQACDSALRTAHGTNSTTGVGDKPRSSTRLSDPCAEAFPDSSSGLYEEGLYDTHTERSYYGGPHYNDQCAGHDSNVRPPWLGADHVTLQRCAACLSTLGPPAAAPLSPPPPFAPAWTMDELPTSSDSSSNDTEYLTPRMIRKLTCNAGSQCSHRAPDRPPKPGQHDRNKPAAPLPPDDDNCSNSKVGPYENYDVPKSTTDQVITSELYDTPKQIRKAFKEDLFQVAKPSSPGSLVLKKNCGCVLKFGSKKKPLVVECEESLQPAECPCLKVTNWANNLISLPYCRKDTSSNKITTEVLTRQKTEEMAIYATVDVSRKTNRQSSSVSEKDSQENVVDTAFTNYQNLEPDKEQEFEGPFANYENMEFALSLEYYESAKDLLKKAGVTQSELDALSANIDEAARLPNNKQKVYMKCVTSQKRPHASKSDEYLLMEPSKDKRELCRTVTPNPGYTPMCPNPNWSQSLKYPLQKLEKVEIEKSLSIPTLNGSDRSQSLDTPSDELRLAIQKRSSSVDSTKILEDLKGFDSSICAATSSSLETLRNLAIDNSREYQDCCKSNELENKTSVGSCSKETPPFRSRQENPDGKRCASVPCKSGGNRDSSSSNDSGVSSCSMKHVAEFQEFEMPLTSSHSRYQALIHRRLRGNLSSLHSSLPRKSKSSDRLRDLGGMTLYSSNVPAKSSSAEAEVPVLPPKQFKGVVDATSTSSGTSDMSDYIETLSIASSHSSTDTPMTLRLSRQPTSTLRPRSGKEYHVTGYQAARDGANYTNLP